MKDLPFEEKTAWLREEVLPLALGAVGEAFLWGKERLAADPEALRLLGRNFGTKSRLMTLGACYAVGVPIERVPSLVKALVMWGALFTMIDTAIDEGNIHDRSGCDRLARWLVVGAPPSYGGEPVSSMEGYLADLARAIDVTLRELPAHALLTAAIDPRLRQHARLVTYQHIAPDARLDYLRELGLEGYEDLCRDGSPGPVFAMVRAAVVRGGSLRAADLAALEELYLPEFGLLHVYADDLVDLVEDAGTKGLNLARAAMTKNRDPGEELLAHLAGYLRRLEGQPARADVLFPLRLMLEDYHDAATKRAAPTGLGALEEAVRWVRAAEETT